MFGSSTRSPFLLLFLFILNLNFTLAQKYSNSSTPATTSPPSLTSHTSSIETGPGPVSITSFSTETLPGQSQGRSTTTNVVVATATGSSRTGASPAVVTANPAPTQRGAVQAVVALVMAAGFAVLLS